MKNESVKKWVLRGLLVAIGLAVAGAIAGYQFAGSDPANSVFRDYYDSVGWENAPGRGQRIWMAISDGMMVVGSAYAGVGLLTWIAGTGFFDMISYGFSSLWVMFTPFKNPKDHPRFHEYKERKREKRKGTKTAILYVGLIFLAVAAAAAGMYYVI